MKLIHTSDWHLGQNFFTRSRKREHQQFLAWLLEVAKREKVDAIIVAGDVFDTGTPPSYARELYNQFVVDIHQIGCTLIVLGGNHDSVSVLNESKQLLSRLDTYVVASTDMPLESQLIEVNNVSGRPGALICAVPFIRPKDVLTSDAGQSGTDKRQALGQAIADHYNQLYELARVRQQALAAQNCQVPIIVTGHLTALGVSQSDSVRDIYIGTLEGFSAEAFPPADYIALGHIHRPQKVAKTEHIRYCGSPIPLSFDEISTDKQVNLVAFDEHMNRDITSLSIPRFQEMAVIRGDLNAISKEINTYSENSPLTWLCIEVDSQDYLTDLQQRIQSLTENRPVEVLQLRRVRHRNEAGLAQQKEETLAELTPTEVFEKRLEEIIKEEPAERVERLRSRFRQILHDVEHLHADSENKK